jgi:FtsZ-binding cell division protein ZapB
MELDLAPESDFDSLANLEERIVKVISLVDSLRKENEKLSDELAEARQAASGEMESLRKEVAELKAERLQVRTRIEKLLGQMDRLAPSAS